MEDRIEGVNDNSVVYKFLDKVATILNDDILTSKINRQGTSNGMNIRVWTKDEEKMMLIESNIDNGVINITLIDKVVGKPWFNSNGYNFATLHKDNSLSCKNFLEQIKTENKKIDAMLDLIIKELDNIGDSKIESKEEDALKKYIEEKKIPASEVKKKKWWMGILEH